MFLYTGTGTFNSVPMHKVWIFITNHKNSDLVENVFLVGFNSYRYLIQFLPSYIYTIYQQWYYSKFCVPVYRYRHVPVPVLWIEKYVFVTDPQLEIIDPDLDLNLIYKKKYINLTFSLKRML
jgi:hypothetical protein